MNSLLLSNSGFKQQFHSLLDNSGCYIPFQDSSMSLQSCVSKGVFQVCMPGYPFHPYMTQIWFLQMLRKTRDPRWNEEFQFMLDEPPLDQKVHIEVLSKRTGLSFRLKVCEFNHLYLAISSSNNFCT